MKVFIYTRTRNYHEETYKIVANDEQEAKQMINYYSEFEIPPENKTSEQLSELDVSTKGISYISSYSL